MLYYSTLAEQREAYTRRLNRVLKKGVVSRIELARRTGISRNTIHRYTQKHYIRLRLTPRAVYHKTKLREALTHDFTFKSELLDYLGWSDGYTRKLSSRYGIQIPDFRSIPKPSRRWQRGKIAEHRDLVDRLLDEHTSCTLIASYLGLTKQTIYNYRDWRRTIS